MRLIIALLIQAVSGVLSGPDPAQMEKAPDLGYRAVSAGLSLPEGMKMGASSSVAVDSRGHLVVFNRGDHPLMEFDPSGTLVRAFGEGQFVRPHGMRIDPEGNIWTTDVAGHTVTKMGPKGDVLMVLGTKGQAGAWDEAGQSRLLTEPTDIGFGPQGDVFVAVGHGKGEPRVLRFDKRGKLLKSWGGLGKGTGQFDLAHSVVGRCEGTGLCRRPPEPARPGVRPRRPIRQGMAIRRLAMWPYVGADQQMYLASGFAGQILKLGQNGKAVAATGSPVRGSASLVKRTI